MYIDCGQAQRQQRIIGGTLTEVNEYPWQALLRFDGDPVCGGTVLSEEWIMTAAHCFDNRQVRNIVRHACLQISLYPLIDPFQSRFHSI